MRLFRSFWGCCLKEASQVRAFFAEEKDPYREGLALVAIASVSFAREDFEDAKERH